MHFWEQFILMSITYVRGSVIKDLSEWKDPFCVPAWRTSFNYSNSDSPGVLGFFKLNTKVEIYAKWYIYIYVICIPHRDCAIMGMCLNKVLVRRI